tara:strand:+ start:540 stop:755 length:216 start_codon:yes stop_codon:yes gene_type:complete
MVSKIKISMKKETLLKILGYISIGLVILITLKYIKMLPAFLKVLALATNVLTGYFAYNNLINNKKTKKNDN